MNQTQAGNTKSTLQIILSIFLLIVAGWIFVNRQYLVDEITISRFTPSSQVAALIDRTTMTTQGQRYFLASRPALLDASEFNQSCPANGEESIVLGCYAGGRIYLFDINDERLDGVREVTAAHEMLHAAYDRIGSDEKERVNALLKKEIAGISDERIVKLFDMYKKNEPSQLMNEAHSILATEATELSPDLESYYQTYFTDRKKVVEYSQQYESVFDGIRARHAEIIAELNTLSAIIERRSEDLNTRNTQLGADIAAYNQKAASPDGFRTQEEADKERSSLMERRNELQQEREEILVLIDQAKLLEDEYKTLLGELESLNKVIDSTPSELPAL